MEAPDWLAAPTSPPLQPRTMTACTSSHLAPSAPGPQSPHFSSQLKFLTCSFNVTLRLIVDASSIPDPHHSTLA